MSGFMKGKVNIIQKAPCVAFYHHIKKEKWHQADYCEFSWPAYPPVSCIGIVYGLWSSIVVPCSRLIRIVFCKNNPAFHALGISLLLESAFWTGGIIRNVLTWCIFVFINAMHEITCSLSFISDERLFLFCSALQSVKCKWSWSIMLANVSTFYRVRRISPWSREEGLDMGQRKSGEYVGSNLQFTFYWTP